MVDNDKEKFLRESNFISTASLFIIFIAYIILSQIKFSIFTIITMVIIILTDIAIFTYIKYKIHIEYRGNDINIMDYISSDLSWRYVIYLSIFFLVVLIVEAFVGVVRIYSNFIILNAFIFFIWAISLNNPMVNLLIRKSRKLEDVFINDEISELSMEMGINEPSVFILDTNNRVANAFEINSKEAYVFITNYLMEILDYNEIIAVLAHELSHIKLKHNRKTSIVTFGLYIILMNFASFGFLINSGILFIFSPLFFIFLIFFITFVIPALKRRNEVAADLNAVKYVDKQYLETALKKISNIDKIPENTLKSLGLDHPSTDKRINLIEKSKL